MDITLDQIIVWLIVGALAGSFVGMLVKRSKEGFGRFTNIGIGLAGALLGGVLFRVFGIELGLGKISVSLQDLVAAVLGSFLFLIGVWFYRWKRHKREP